MLESLFNKAIKETPTQVLFSVKFAKFLRTPIL